MAGYVIGSDKGKQIANGMKAGDTYKASDGSTWKKNSNGTVTVTTKTGGVTANALGGSSSSSGVSSKLSNTLGSANVSNSSMLYGDDATMQEIVGGGSTVPAWLNTNPGLPQSGIGNTGAITGSDYYEKMLREQQSGITSRMNAAIDANNAYIPQINQQSDKALQNAYIANQQAKMQTPQALNALGYTGGATESTLLGLATNYQNSRNTIETERQNALTGIRQNEQQIRATGDASLSDAAASYWQNLVTAAQQAEQQAQAQSNWAAEFALQKQQYSDSTAQQAWANQYAQDQFSYQQSQDAIANQLAQQKAASTAAAKSTAAKSTAATSSGNYNTVWANVQKALGGSNAGSSRAFDAVINYIQQSLKGGLITQNEAQQMLGRLNL